MAGGLWTVYSRTYSRTKYSIALADGTAQSTEFFSPTEVPSLIDNDTCYFFSAPGQSDKTYAP